MAFSTEIQSSQSRPQTLNHNQITTNHANSTGTEASTYDNDNNQFRKFGKHHLDDTGTTTIRNYRNPHSRIHDYTAIKLKQQLDIEQESAKQQSEEHSKQLTEQHSEQLTEQHSEQQESDNVNSNTETEFETKNIFAYEACETSTGSDSYPISAAPPQPEKFEFITTPPPSENIDSDKYSEPDPTENHKNTLFTKVTIENVFSEKQSIKSSAKERSNSSPTRGHSIPECKPLYYDSRVSIRGRKQARILYTSPTRGHSKPNNTTSEYYQAIVSKFFGDQQPVANPQKRQENNTTEYSFKQFEFVREQNNSSTIDFGINGRHRVDRCRYVPFTSGYEWSNAAYCYS